MNELLELYARQQIIEGLNQCTPEQVDVYRRMYNHNQPKGITIEEMVNLTPTRQLDWALSQIERTLKEK